MIFAVGMWVHILLNALVCFTPTRNPIWGELRVLAVILATAALWMVLVAAVGPANL